MGNTIGVVREGLTIVEAAKALRAVLGNRFPGRFTVESPEISGDGIGVKFLSSDTEFGCPVPGTFCLVWFEWGYHPGMIGGNRIEGFDLLIDMWLQDYICHTVAVLIGGNCYDEGRNNHSYPPNPQRYDDFYEWRSRFDLCIKKWKWRFQSR